MNVTGKAGGLLTNRGFPYASLSNKAGRFRKHEFELEGRAAIKFEDVGKRGHFLVVRHKKLAVVPDSQFEDLGGNYVAIFFVLSGLSDPEAKSFESAYVPGAFLCHSEGMQRWPQFVDEDGDTKHMLENKVMHVVKPPRQVGENQKLTGTGIENTGEVEEPWKAVCTFRMVHDEVKLPGGKKAVTKSDMIHGWDGGRVDWKLNKLLEQMDDGDEGLLFDASEEKVLIAGCALALGKSTEWLLNGAGGWDVASWRGIEVNDKGQISGIDWSGEGLHGPLPDDFAKLEGLTKLDLSNNFEVQEEVPVALGKLRSRLGVKNCVLFTRPDKRSETEKYIDDTFKNLMCSSRTQVARIYAMFMVLFILGMVIFSGSGSDFATAGLWFAITVLILLKIFAHRDLLMSTFKPKKPPPPKRNRASKRASQQASIKK